MILTADLIRAARGLKNWSQAELARRVGMATPSIGNIEAGKHNPSQQTQSAIRNAFEENGIEFIDGGVRKRQDLITIYEGKDCYLRLLDYASRVLVEKKGEILFSSSDERRSPPEVVERFRAMRRSGITMRSLIGPNDTYVMGKLDEYRCMPGELFLDSDVKTIFDDYVAYLISWQDVPKVILIKETNIAAEARRSFNFKWSVSPRPERTTAPNRYE